MTRERETDGEKALTGNNITSFRRRVTGHRDAVASAPFAGRIGGNQEFIAIGDDEATEEILKKQPDAAPLKSLSDVFNLNSFFVLATWKQAFIEGWGSCLLVFVLGAASSGLTISEQSVFANTLYAALVNWIGLTLFVFSAAPVSGGHLNPSISLATFFAGLSTFPRTVMYIAAQAIGGIVGGYWLRLALGDDYYFPTGVIPGCTVDPKFISVGQMFVLEFIFSQALIFVAFGVGLDPRQANVFGAALSPILVGLSLALGTLAASLVKPGYTGVSFNSARCLGLMTAKGNLQHHWVHWVGPLAATMLNGLFYHFAPPYVHSKPMNSLNPSHVAAAVLFSHNPTDVV